MSDNFLTILIALRRAKGVSGRETKTSGYRTLARQDAQGFGRPWLGESPDEVLFRPLIPLWNMSCLELRKFEPSRSLWWDFSEIGDFWQFISGNGFTMRLTPRGEALLSEMESRLATARIQ
jgi:hypothetical protein